MRIIGGRFSGRHLAELGAGAPAAQLRPTSDRTREALFNVLSHGPYPSLTDARVLDLFAGTGALGLEALSRGAARALFVEENPKARAIIRENVEALGLTGEAKIYRRDATRLGPNRAAPYDLVFLDPPYGKGLAEPAIASALAGDWVAAQAAIVVELAATDRLAPTPAGFDQTDHRRYGDTQILILAR